MHTVVDSACTELSAVYISLLCVYTHTYGMKCMLTTDYADFVLLLLLALSVQYIYVGLLCSVLYVDSCLLVSSVWSCEHRQSHVLYCMYITYSYTFSACSTGR